MNALIESEVADLTAENKALVVASPNDVTKATAVVRGIKQLIDKVKESYDPIVERAHSAHKEAIAQRDKYLKPLKAKKEEYENAITDYTKRMQEEQRIREAEVNAELAKVAEANKQKLLEEAGKATNEWEAETLKEKAAEVKPITVDTQTKFVEEKGVVTRRTWKARVVDVNKLPRTYMVVNESELNRVAKDAVIRGEGIPGVEFYEELNTTVRS